MIGVAAGGFQDVLAERQRPLSASFHPPAPARAPEGLQRIARARTMHGSYSAENRQVAAMIRVLKVGAKRLVELT